jgi:septum formation inhibitor MinC
MMSKKVIKEAVEQQPAVPTIGPLQCGFFTIAVLWQPNAPVESIKPAFMSQSGSWPKHLNGQDLLLAVLEKCKENTQKQLTNEVIKENVANGIEATRTIN